MPQAQPMHPSSPGRSATAGDNAGYQRRLAESLISSMGPDEAIHWCHVNGWEGVLRVLLALQSAARDRPSAREASPSI